MPGFYPKLERKGNYPTKVCGGYYADYNVNKVHIVNDCNSRCVYCDILLAEVGFEGMQLDHFRPQKHFSHLKSSPYNLVLSCQKCNRLKSDHWPASKEDDMPSHQNGVGFIDPFIDDPSDFLSVNKQGVIEEIKSPTKYAVKLMQLNRAARVQTRRKRILKKVRDKYVDEVTSRMESLHSLMIKKEISYEDATAQLGKLTKLHAEIQAIQI